MTPAAKRRYRKARHVSAGNAEWNKPKSLQGRYRACAAASPAPLGSPFLGKGTFP
jgi:hypothetical protein